MKKSLFMLFLLSFIMMSCELSNEWDGKPGVPSCQYCNGKGYFTKTDLLIFQTVYDCNCLERYNNNDYYYDGGSNVNFEGSETSRKRGAKCHHRDYGEGNYSECSDKFGGCSGFSPQNRDPRACANCPHRVDDHY